MELAWLPTPRSVGDRYIGSGDDDFAAHFKADGFLGDGPVYACVAVPDEILDFDAMGDENADDWYTRDEPTSIDTTNQQSQPSEEHDDQVTFALEPPAGHPLERFVFTDLASLGTALSRQQQADC